MSADVERLVRETLDQLAGQVEVPAEMPARLRDRLARPRRDWPLALPPVLTLAVGLWGATARPYWGDEIDTLSAAARTVPRLLALLGHVDAVHGLYYLLMVPVTRVLGMGVFATRLPSVLAMAAAAFGVAVIGRRLRSLRAGVYAGLVFTVLPIVSQQAHDARPYAMVTAAAVLSSYLLLRVVSERRAAWCAWYGLSLALLGYLELFALLLVPAHAVTLAVLATRQRMNARSAGPGRHRDESRWAGLVRPWLIAAAAGCLAVLPVVVWGWRERDAIAWITPPGWPDISYLARWLAAGSAGSVALLVLLALVGWRHADAPIVGRPRLLAALRWPGRALSRSASLGPRLRRPGIGLARPAPPWPAPPWLAPPWLAPPWLAPPWLVVPPLVLVAASYVSPVYSFRYIVFCLPAVALLAGAGLAALSAPLRLSALALVVALAAPAQLALRVPGSGYDGGVQAAAQVLAARERPGDAVVYAGGGIPPWALAYPGAFGPLRNISLGGSAASLGRLYSSSAPAPVVVARERGVTRVWVVESSTYWRDPASYLAPGFHLAHRWQPGHSQAWLALYERR